MSGHADLPDDGLPRRDPGSRRPWLLVAALAETLTLAGLLVNRFVIDHSSAVAAALGPVHGALYLGGVLLTWTLPFPRGVKLLAVVPLVGVWAATIWAPRLGSGLTRG